MRDDLEVPEPELFTLSQKMLTTCTFIVVVVVVLLFYVHAKHLMSCWDGQLT